MEFLPLHKEHYHAVSKIYNEGIETGIATFETVVPSWEIFNEKFLPVCRFIAKKNDRIVGWCTLSAISKREVYKGVAETTIYIAKDARGKGIGKKLLQHLVFESEKAGFWTLQARIFPQNIASIELHKNAGFRVVGIKEKIGQRLGVWHDNVELERRSKKVNYAKND
ncbi:GNAT family N-acetyltransferase [Aureisphaera sp. CAU 1614]|uniref:GNAT family N-acetyltransferase n=1 Tax=Halomarinibacterium sedimenti TaxID=2857106 RepID=A0A9X1FQ82_9FLAO|nr:GNAT family N-acetyltransferase [Halomarinibacterium sedimenti]MBW2938520.1 GNAT family N-acetyltransferase [Halomarinibacterium sedimenti]